MAREGSDALRTLRIAVVELVPQGPATSLWARVMNANMVSIMPPVVAYWCQRAGHHVTCVTYTGFEDLLAELPADADVVFVSSFTRSALLAYAVSELCRRRGAVTVLGGPHARCYPDDARRHFDYVLGFTDEALVQDLLRDPSPQRPAGLALSAARQPSALPPLGARWPFMEPTLRKAPLLKLVPMVGSLGCPYRCSFCIDAEVDYQQLPFDQLREDLRFLAGRMKRPRVGWHDPNFGVRFDEYADAIEEAVPPGSMDHVAESSLSLLSERRLERLRRIGFKGLLPGVESWYEMGDKSRSGRRTGLEKVRDVGERVRTVLRYVPYVQVNFVLGLDSDRGAEPFELTKRFLDLTPGAFPAYSLLTAFGEAAPLNLALQQAGRVLPFPFHFLDNNQAMNVRPAHYTWPELYDRLIDLQEYSFSWRSVARRLSAQGPGIGGFMNVVRAVSSEGRGRIRYNRLIRGLLDTDREVRAFMEGDTEQLPAFYRERIRRKLGPLWSYLPAGALRHDPNAYLMKQRVEAVNRQ